MAYSIPNPWIHQYLIGVAEMYGGNLSSVPYHQKWKKGQIAKFLTSEQPDQTAFMWVHLSDKQYTLPVRFSKEAVDAYYQNPQTPKGHLSTHQTALVRIKEFRPMFTRVPLGKGQRMSPEYIIALEATSFELLGSLDDEIWDTPQPVGSDPLVSEWAHGLSAGGGGGNVLKIRARAKKEGPAGVSDKPILHKSNATLHFPTLPRNLVKDHKSRPVTHSDVAKPSRRNSNEREIDALKSYRRAWHPISVYLHRYDGVTRLFEDLLEAPLVSSEDDSHSPEPLASPKEVLRPHVNVGDLDNSLRTSFPLSPHSVASDHISSQFPRTPSHWSSSIRGSPALEFLHSASQSPAGSDVGPLSQPSSPILGIPMEIDNTQSPVKAVINDENLSPNDPAEAPVISSSLAAPTPAQRPKPATSLSPARSQQFPGQPLDFIRKPRFPLKQKPLQSEGISSSPNRSIHPPSSGPGRILVPNSDTSGTTSSQVRSQSLPCLSQSQGESQPLARYSQSLSYTSASLGESQQQLQSQSQSQPESQSRSRVQSQLRNEVLPPSDIPQEPQDIARDEKASPQLVETPAAKETVHDSPSLVQDDAVLHETQASVPETPLGLSQAFLEVSNSRTESETEEEDELIDDDMSFDPGPGDITADETRSSAAIKPAETSNAACLPQSPEIPLFNNGTPIGEDYQLISSQASQYHTHARAPGKLPSGPHLSSPEPPKRPSSPDVFISESSFRASSPKELSIPRDHPATPASEIQEPRKDASLMMVDASPEIPLESAPVVLAPASNHDAEAWRVPSFMRNRESRDAPSRNKRVHSSPPSSQREEPRMAKRRRLVSPSRSSIAISSPEVHPPNGLVKSPKVVQVTKAEAEPSATIQRTDSLGSTVTRLRQINLRRSGSSSSVSSRKSGKRGRSTSLKPSPVIVSLQDAPKFKPVSTIPEPPPAVSVSRRPSIPLPSRERTILPQTPSPSMQRLDKGKQKADSGQPPPDAFSSHWLVASASKSAPRVTRPSPSHGTERTTLLPNTPRQVSRLGTTVEEEPEPASSSTYHIDLRMRQENGMPPVTWSVLDDILLRVGKARHKEIQRKKTTGD